MKPEIVITVLIAVLIVVGGIFVVWGLGLFDTPEDPINNDLPFNDDPEETSVILFYYNPEFDTDETGNIMCSREGIVGVERTITANEDELIEETIRLLLQGDLTEQEQEEGVETEYPLEGFELVGTELENQTLTLVFEDPNNEAVGGSCRTGILWFQIEATALQFPEVESVQFSPEDELFQP